MKEEGIYHMKRGIRQHDTRDCGAACLATVLLWHGANIPLIEIRQRLRVDKNGVSLFAICRVGEMFGLDTNGYCAELNELIEGIENHNIGLPIIVHTVLNNNLQHYMVIRRISHKNIYLFDPQKGAVKYSIEEFKRIFTGNFITLLPSNKFFPQKRNFRKYRKYLRIITGQKKLFLLAICCSLISAIVSIIASLGYQIIIDNYILNGKSDILKIPVVSNGIGLIEAHCTTLVQLLLAILGLYLVQASINGIRGILVTYIYRNSSKYLAYNYYSHLLKLPIPFFHDRETGEILSRFQDIGEIQAVISGIGLTIILNIFMALAGGIVLYSISNVMMIIVIVIVMIYGMLAFIYKRPIQNINRNIMEADAQVMCEIKEVVGGIESIKSFSAEQIFYDRLHDKTEDLLEKEKRGSLISVSQTMLLSLIEGIGNILILWTGCYFILTGKLSLGQFIAFETLIYFFISPMESLLFLQVELQKGFVAVERLDDILEVEKEKDTPGTFEKNDIAYNDDFKIEVNNLVFSYGFRECVLDGISFKIRQSEKVLIRGKSGCGKTTLLHVLSKMETDYSGTITFGAKELKYIPTSLFRKQVVYVPQNTEIFSGTIIDNILLEKSVSEEKLRSVIYGCQLDELIYGPHNGFEMLVEENGKNLSGGQKQRIALARALIMEPKVLLLDESMCHLDDDTEGKLLEYLWSEFSEMIIIIVSHRECLHVKYDRVIEI